MKIKNRKELQHIAMNILADIDYNDFVRIYGECTRKPFFFFWQLIQHLTVADQIKILDKKNMQNEAQYDLDRKAVKISALSSNNFDKYEYLAGEDVGLKSSTLNMLDLIILHWVNF